MDSKQVSQATTGAIVIVVGLVLLGGQLQMGLDLGRLWPLILIVIGAGRFLSVNDEGQHGNGAWLLFIGGLFLLNNFRIMGLGDTWPLFIVAFGLQMIFDRGDRRSRRRRGTPIGPDAAPADRFGDGRFQS